MDGPQHYLQAELYERIRDPRDGLFAFLQGAALDGLWYWDLERPDQEWLSPEFKRLFGYEDHEVPNSPTWWQENMHPEDVARVVENFERHRDDPAVPFDQVVRYRHRDGSTVWVRCRGCVLRDAQGRPIRMLGAHTDVTPVKQAEARIDELNRELAAKVEALERSNTELAEFAHLASHDLKAPLRGLSNYASFLYEDYRQVLDDDGRRMLEALPRLCQSLDKLIGDILDYSRARSCELARVPVRLDASLDEAQSLLGALLESEEVELRRAPDLPRVVGDPTRLGQVLQNLIANGVHFNESRPKVIEVTWREDPEDAARVLVVVRDNGIGMDPRFHREAFRMFRRLHGPGQYGGGSGSGLAIVERLVARLGGRVWIESAPGEGCSVFVSLERAPEDPACRS